MTSSQYIALARKWRPKTFSMLIGQNHITSVLCQALEKNRLHHAYLFTGTRGVGKTSLARIFAKALNCEKGISSTPCLQCDTCLSIEQGRYIDLIEIDAASKTRVEDTRDLLESTLYTPTLGRYKVYLIDEVHMLSNHSFNALLKTLEEPPSHVKFLLATTDPQKLPATILSRCLQFYLKPLTECIIQSQLETILTAEKMSYEQKATQCIAKAAQGSMRDALSLLEQAISLEHDSLTYDQVEKQLGLTQYDYTADILSALLNRTPAQLIQISRAILENGGNYEYILSTILHDLHHIHLLQLLPSDVNIETASSLFKTLARCFLAEDLQLLYEIALKGTQDIKIAPSPMIGFEMTLLRMYTFTPVTENIPANIPAPCSEVPLSEMSLPEAPFIHWESILPKLNLSGITKAAMDHATLVDYDFPLIQLSAHKTHESLFSKNIILKIETALSTYFEQPIRIEIHFLDHLIDKTPAQKKQDLIESSQQECLDKLMQDPVFETVQTLFSAKIMEGSVEPIKNNL